MKDETVRFSIDAGVARIVIDDTDRHNVISARLTQELARAAIACEGRPDVRVVLLSAAGDKFSVGGDLGEFLEARGRLREHVREMATYFHLAIAVLNRLETPVVCAVNGIAAGGGVSLAIMCDLTVAKRSAKFNLAYTRSGLTPDGGSSWFLPRLVGMQRAFDIMATNPTLTAEEASELGLIARVVDDEAFDDTVEALVEQLRDMPSNAAGRAKRLLRASMSNSLEQQLELESLYISQSAAHSETLAKLEAFCAARRG